jgi:regulator of nucleoside diphosphate kinase
MTLTALQATAAADLRTITELDHVRLRRLLDRDAGDAHARLRDALDQATLVDPHAVAADVVTMYSRVRVRDCARGTEHVYTLCYPADAEPGEGFISVLSPMGVALIGQRVGQRVRVARPDGGASDFELRQILFQEATGDYTT